MMRGGGGDYLSSGNPIATQFEYIRDLDYKDSLLLAQLPANQKPCLTVIVYWHVFYYESFFVITKPKEFFGIYQFGQIDYQFLPHVVTRVPKEDSCAVWSDIYFLSLWFNFNPWNTFLCSNCIFQIVSYCQRDEKEIAIFFKSIKQNEIIQLEMIVYNLD